MSKSHTLSNEFLNSLFRAASGTYKLVLYQGSLAATDATCTPIESEGSKGYNSQNITTTHCSASALGALKNDLLAITFGPAASSAWTPATGIALVRQSDSKVMVFDAFSSAKTIAVGESLVFDVNQITATEE